MGLPLPSAEPQPGCCRQATGSNLGNLPWLICRGGFSRVPVKPTEEVSTPQLFVFVPVKLLVAFIVLMQLLVRLHVEPDH